MFVKESRDFWCWYRSKDETLPVVLGPEMETCIKNN